jgi:hypothetical protein
MPLPKSVIDNKKIIRSLLASAGRLAEEVKKAVVEDPDAPLPAYIVEGKNAAPVINGTHRLTVIKRVPSSVSVSLSFGFTEIENPDEPMLWKYWEMLPQHFQWEVAMYMIDIFNQTK